jgi:N-sulfoglucosamine sulfohydrolase
MNLNQYKSLIPGGLSAILAFCSTGTLHSQTGNNQTQHAKKQPNILWISTEDLSPHLGCYGDKVARTPNIDRLALQGVRYTNVFTTAAISAPCRAGIITGMYQTSIGCMHMRTTSYRRSAENPLEFTAVPPHYVKAFTEYMRIASYYYQ